MAPDAGSTKALRQRSRRRPDVRANDRLAVNDVVALCGGQFTVSFGFLLEKS